VFTGLSQSIATLIVVVAFYAMDFVLIVRNDRRRQAPGSGRSWSYTLMMLTAVALVVAQPALLPELSLRTDGWWGG